MSLDRLGGDWGSGFGAALPIIAWFMGPVRWVVQNHPGITEADWRAQVLACQEYGLYFFLAVGVFESLYMGFPCLREICLKLRGRH